jgi:hypothetical protein
VERRTPAFGGFDSHPLPLLGFAMERVYFDYNSMNDSHDMWRQPCAPFLQEYYGIPHAAIGPETLYDTTI